MRLLVLSPGFPAYPGAFTPGVVDTLVGLAETHRVEVRCVRSPLPQRGRIRFRGLDVVSASGVAGLKGVLAAAGSADVVWALWPNRTGDVAVIAARAAGKPLVLSLMGAELANLPEVDYGTCRTLRGRLRMQALLRAADLVTAGSTQLIDKAAGFGATRAEVAPLGVPMARITRRQRPPGGRAILVVSDSSAVKRPDLVCQVVRRRDDVTLSIYGADPSGQWAALAAEAPVTFHGFTAAPAVYAAYAEHDVLLHPSAHESQGMALIEAAAAGLPVVCWDVGVASALAALGAAVHLVADPCDVDDRLAAAFADSTRGASAVRQAFDLDRCVARWSALLESVH